MSRRRLDSCTAVVTGASGGIGRAIALELARHKSRLVLTARRSQQLNSVAREAERLSGMAPTVVVGDLTQPTLRVRVMQAVNSTGQPLDLLVNNAGVSAHGRFAQADPARLGQILNVNFQAAAELTRLALPLLQRGADPVIVNVGSVLAYRGVPHNSEYCASKAALRAWSQALRAELASEAIDVMLVTPGTTETEFFDHLLEKQEELPWGRPRGVTAELVARKTMHGLEKRRREVTPGWRAKLFVWAARFAPGLMDRAMKRYG